MHVHWTYWNQIFSSETLVQSFDKHCEKSYIVVVEPTSMTKLIAHPVYRWLAIKVCLSSQQQSNNRNNWNNSLTEQISDSQFASSKSIFDNAFRKTTRISCCSVYQVNKRKGSGKELLRIELRSERAGELVSRDSRQTRDCNTHTHSHTFNRNMRGSAQNIPNMPNICKVTLAGCTNISQRV